MRKSFNRAASIASMILFISMIANSYAGSPGGIANPGLSNSDLAQKALTALKTIDIDLTGGQLQVALEKNGQRIDVNQTDLTASLKTFTQTPYFLVLAIGAALWILGPAIKPLRRKVEESLKNDTRTGKGPRKTGLAA